MMLTCTRTADSNRKALKASFQRADFQSAEFRRRESNPRRVIMSHVLFPTELLRWHNEPPAPNGTRRAMLSLSAPDRCAEPEPLFEPRSRYPVDERHCGARPDSFGTSRTRRFRPGGTGWSGTGHRVRVPAGRRLHPLRHRRAIEAIRVVKERSGCSRIRSGQQKTPVKPHACRGFVSGRQVADVSSAGLPADVRETYLMNTPFMRCTVQSGLDPRSPSEGIGTARRRDRRVPLRDVGSVFDKFVLSFTARGVAPS